MQGALENAKLKVVFGTGRQTAQALASQLYLPDPEAVKHVVEDAEQQARSHPLFENLYNQAEMAVQELMRLKSRHVIVKLPDSDRLYNLKTPTVAGTVTSRSRLDEIKRVLARQSGRTCAELTRELAARLPTQANQEQTTRNAVDASSTHWTHALWRQRPMAEQTPAQEVFVARSDGTRSP
jgi:hypothetical protein